MKNFIKILIFSLFAINAYAQQATEIDSKSVRLPRYANLAAITNITTGITTPTQGMMVYNIETASNWYYNGTAWTNTLGAVSAPLNLNLSDIGGTTFTGIHTNSGAPGAPGGVGITGSSIGGEYGAGIFGLGTEANYGVRGHNSDFWGVFGTGLVGGVFQGATALRTSGALQFGGLGVGTISAGKVLTATDNLGNASWENLVPYSKTLNETSDLLRLTNIGTGGAGFFRINNSLNSNNAVHAATYGSGSAIYGLAENENGYAATFESVNGFPTLKSTNYENGNAGKFEINNINSTGHTLLVNTNGLGRGGWFQSTNPLNNAAALIAENYGLGQGIYGTNFGTGKAGVFEINNSSNTNIALHAITNGDGDSFYSYTGGLGRAGIFQIDNASNSANALSSTTNGTGKAAYFQGTNALETNGTIKFGGSGVGTPATGKVLTATDALGNATWQSIPAVAAPLSLSSTATTLTSTSTIGTAANFSSTSGYALITGTGNVGIGTNTPTAKLDVAGYTKLGDDATAPKIKMKELAVFNSAATYNGQSPQAHGLTASKIIGVSVLLEWTTGYFVPVEYSSDVNLRYNFFISPTEIIVQNNTPGPTCPYICGKPVKVLITYKE